MKTWDEFLPTKAFVFRVGGMNDAPTDARQPKGRRIRCHPIRAWPVPLRSSSQPTHHPARQCQPARLHDWVTNIAYQYASKKLRFVQW